MPSLILTISLTFEICLCFGKAIVGEARLCFVGSQATQHAGLPVADESSKWQSGAIFICFLA
jgi:hypothetical protein